jgi:dTDP-4-dehydrorhamnose 3,5-epimerase
MAQGKLVRVTKGEVCDVAVDLRENSPTFGKWVAEILSAENQKQLWIPEGFAHGFLTLSEEAEFLYKTTNYYSKNHERSIIWNDKDLDIKWPIESVENYLNISEKDQLGCSFLKADKFI